MDDCIQMVLEKNDICTNYFNFSHPNRCGCCIDLDNALTYYKVNTDWDIRVIVDAPRTVEEINCIS